jgi:curli biogenesis system outer membrane secretion channel CsgG
MTHQPRQTALPGLIPALVVGLAAGHVAACGGGSGRTTPPIIARAPTPAEARICENQIAGVYGVTALKNKTKADADLTATDDLLATAMSGSGCFTVAERDKVDLLISEMKLCDPDANADSAYFNCGSFAQKGKLLGLSDLVVGDVVMIEPNVRGTDVHTTLPWIGGVSFDQSYAAVAVSLRVLHVEDGKVRTSLNVSALVPSQTAGLDLAVKSFSLGAAVNSKTPMGQALEAMITDGVRRLHDSLAAANDGSAPTSASPPSSDGGR